MVTGDHRNAGTDSKVFITLFGHQGQTTRKIPLLKSSNKNPFEHGQTDIFHEQAEYIGELVKVRIEHDNTGIGPGWLLNKVGSLKGFLTQQCSVFQILITNEADPKTTYSAVCNRWLAKDEDDRQISRDLPLSKSYETAPRARE